ncbi:MAG: hypothetical protein KF723_19775 [Rhizobiaceae bacterium]|nr:hypothetical protein [Rhizobiaceae bacterium]
MNDNRRETGARKPVERPGEKPQSPLDSSDRGDRPKTPFGLTEDEGDVDARQRVERDPA